MEFADMEKVFAAFGLGGLQDVATALRIMEKNDISPEEFRAFVREIRLRRTGKSTADVQRTRKQIREQRKKIERLSPKCPSCGIPMALREVHPPDPGTGDPGDPSEGTHWTCPKCRFGRYDRRTIQEVRKSLGLA